MQTGSEILKTCEHVGLVFIFCDVEKLSFQEGIKIRNLLQIPQHDYCVYRYMTRQKEAIFATDRETTLDQIIEDEGFTYEVHDRKSSEGFTPPDEIGDLFVLCGNSSETKNYNLDEAPTLLKAYRDYTIDSMNCSDFKLLIELPNPE